MTVSASKIVDLLAMRHSKDVFVPECKTGPTQGVRHARMDAWVMPRSWAHPSIIAYEIKVSRSDFLADDKWPTYLKYCNEFYFVCAPNVCQTAEISDDAGLIVTSKNGARLFRKKKAPYREVDIPEDLFRYVLMSRCLVGEAWAVQQSEDNAASWQRWLKNRKRNKELGNQVRYEIRRLVNESRREAEKQRQLAGDFERVRDVLAALGLDRPEAVFDLVRAAEEKVKHLTTGAHWRALERDLGLIASSATDLRKKLADMQQAEIRITP